jgi:hypothetical protein
VCPLAAAGPNAARLVRTAAYAGTYDNTEGTDNLLKCLEFIMTTLQDRFNINSQLEHLQTKYVGTGVHACHERCVPVQCARSDQYLD